MCDICTVIVQSTFSTNIHILLNNPTQETQVKLCFKVLERGVGLSTHTDSELITQALCLNPPEGEVNGPNWPARIRHLMQLAPLSYSIVVMLKDRIYAVRDPYGNRPLCLGRILSADHSK